MNGTLCRQLALDYCCAPGEILGGGNVFTEYRPLEGRRRFQEREDCILKIALPGALRRLRLGVVLRAGQPACAGRAPARRGRPDRLCPSLFHRRKADGAARGRL